MAEDFVLAAVGAFVLDAFAAAFLASLDDWAPANWGTNRAIANAIPMAAGERTKRLRMWPPRRVVSICFATGHSSSNERRSVSGKKTINACSEQTRYRTMPHGR